MKTILELSSADVEAIIAAHLKQRGYRLGEEPFCLHGGRAVLYAVEVVNLKPVPDSSPDERSMPDAEEE